jgi:hypothetical protein
MTALIRLPTPGIGRMSRINSTIIP